MSGKDEKPEPRAPAKEKKAGEMTTRELARRLFPREARREVERALREEEERELRRKSSTKGKGK